MEGSCTVRGLYGRQNDSRPSTPGIAMVELRGHMDGLSSTASRTRGRIFAFASHKATSIVQHYHDQ